MLKLASDTLPSKSRKQLSIYIALLSLKTLFTLTLTRVCSNFGDRQIYMNMEAKNISI